MRFGLRSRGLARCVLLGAGFAAVPVAGQNLLVNSDFNTLGDASGWFMVAGEDFEVSGGDADACFDSYSGIGEGALTGPNVMTIVQCVVNLPAGPGGTLTARIDYQVSETGLALPDVVSVGVHFYDQAGCAGLSFGGQVAEGAPAVTWTPLEVSAPRPPTALSAVFVVGAVSDVADPFFVAFDRAYLGFAPRVFADDYEPEQLCRWSSTQP